MDHRGGVDDASPVQAYLLYELIGAAVPAPGPRRKKDGVAFAAPGREENGFLSVL
jgi:hypothetical protein